MKRIDITNINSISDEPRGTNEKYWIKYQNLNCLVKFNSDIYSDLDIMEALASDILNEIGIDAVKVKLATSNNNNCCLVASFLEQSSDILLDVDFNWVNRRDTDVFRNIKMSFGKVFGMFYKLYNISEDNLNELIYQYITKTLGDIIIGNEDGKLRNTGIIFNENSKKYKLAPSFDNGLAFHSFIYNTNDAICHIGNQDFDNLDVLEYIINEYPDLANRIIDNFNNLDYLKIVNKYQSLLVNGKYDFIISYLDNIKNRIALLHGINKQK